MKGFIFFSLSLLSFLVSANESKMAYFEGVYSDASSCHVKIAYQDSAYKQDWLVYLKDSDLVVALDSKFSIYKKDKIRLQGDFQVSSQSQMAYLPHIPNKFEILPIYRTTAEIIFKNKTPSAYYLSLENINFLKAFDDKSKLCSELKLVKFWPCEDSQTGFLRKGNWCFVPGKEDLLF